ncbi:benenodin family lasso peptide [Sphingomonas sp. MMSM24]|uniref:Benenodin family lasso peptide n=1 Tax=Sphingomonas lycopersici TaxID=2951807 RepID=A0AA42CS49_9SPHN|nr:benenodin family lasso peptide [Sphingomonas lycopersici]
MLHLRSAQMEDIMEKYGEELIDLGVATEETKGHGFPDLDGHGGQNAGIDNE